MSGAGRLTSVSIMASLAVMSLFGCAARKDLAKGPEKDLVLEYKMTENQVLRYGLNSGFVQTLSVRDETIEVKAEEMRRFSLRPGPSRGKELELEVTIDSMELDIVSPQGKLVPDVSAVIGKSFNMTVSPLGEELDLSGADTIQYELGPEGKRSIKSQFESFFPDLPGRPISLKDTWTTETTMNEGAGDDQLTVVLVSENKLVGFEVVDGFECAKIEAPFTGTLHGKGQEQGVDLITEGKVKGTGTWYFAYEEGIYVKETSSGTAEGVITAKGPLEVVIPMKRDFYMEVKLVK